ncbi:hypothetical protein GWK47_045973 [Chionoecetes opilio]|uniref:Uncharacterized protein n=1 Tax=Chionoecetes opilio TaxID=41210 RepID=A0A8J4Y6N6_CHIOP|nr:hypothetical protein GWK47_045973 [Chionoecetes opilio]
MDACRLHSSVQYRPLDPPANRNDEWDGASLDVFSRPSVHPDPVRTGLNQGALVSSGLLFFEPLRTVRGHRGVNERGRDFLVRARGHRDTGEGVVTRGWDGLEETAVSPPDAPTGKTHLEVPGRAAAHNNPDLVPAV